MAKVKKSTKKFNQHRLKSELKRRNVSKVIKKQQRIKEDRRSMRQEQEQDQGRDDALFTQSVPVDQDKADVGSDMDQDLFEDDRVFSDEHAQEETDGEVVQEEDLGREIQEHQEHLKKLQEQDPEFYDYLSKNNKELLDFEVPAGLESEAAAEEEEMEEEEDQEEMEGQLEEEEDLEEAFDSDDDEELEEFEQDTQNEITMDQVTAWQKQVEATNSMKALKKLLKAYKVAVQSSSETPQESDTVIQDETVYRHLLSVMPSLGAKSMHAAFSQPTTVPTGHKKWNQMQPLVKSYVSTTTLLLQQITETSMQVFVLRELDRACAALFFACFPKSKVVKDFQKVLLQWWAGAPSTEVAAGKDETAQELNEKRQAAEQKAIGVESVRILSFLVLRQFAVYAPDEYLGVVLKNTYCAFISAAAHYTLYTAPKLNFMMNCMIELHAIDPTHSYQHAFKAIRQLAIQLRNAITHQTPETTRSVLNWQSTLCLRLWCRLIAHHSTTLQQLLFPLTQIGLGIAMLMPTSTYFPLRLHILRALSDLGSQTHTLIPISPQLLEIVQALPTDTQKTSMKPLDLAFALRAPKTHLKSKVYADTILEQTLALWADHLAPWSTHVGFPEMVVPVLVHLKQWCKRCKCVKWSKMVAAFVQKVSSSRDVVLAQRKRVDFAPVDLEKCREFSETLDSSKTPLGLYCEHAKRIRMRLGASASGSVGR